MHSAFWLLPESFVHQHHFWANCIRLRTATIHQEIEKRNNEKQIINNCSASVASQWDKWKWEMRHACTIFQENSRNIERGVSKRGNASQSSLMSAAPVQPSWCFMAWQTDYCGFCGAHSFKDVSKYRQQQQQQLATTMTTKGAAVGTQNVDSLIYFIIIFLRVKQLQVWN